MAGRQPRLQHYLAIITVDRESSACTESRGLDLNQTAGCNGVLPARSGLIPPTRASRDQRCEHVARGCFEGSAAGNVASWSEGSAQQRASKATPQGTLP